MATYNKNTNYTDLIEQAAKTGNMTEAAYLEQLRNNKIDGEGLDYEKTYKYQNFLQDAVTSAGKGAAGYESPYSSQIDAGLKELQNSSWGGWDKDNDESYAAYRKQYLREADRGVEDVLGEYAQNTGGVASSAAITAASQAGDYYRSQLADKIPELYTAAYNRYLNELTTKQQNLSAMMQAESQRENQYYNRINQAMSKWAQLGYADADVAGILGVAIGTPTTDQAYTNWSTAFQEKQYADALAAAAGRGGGGGGGGDTVLQELPNVAVETGTPQYNIFLEDDKPAALVPYTQTPIVNETELGKNAKIIYNDIVRGGVADEAMLSRIGSWEEDGKISAAEGEYLMRKMGYNV